MKPYFSLGIFLIGTPLSQAAVVLYSESFDNTTGSNQSYATTGWVSYSGSDTTVANTTGGVVISSGAGAGTTNGFAYDSAVTGGQNRTLWYTTLGTPFSLSDIESFTFSVYAGASDGTNNNGLAIAIRVGNDWYRRGSHRAVANNTWAEFTVDQTFFSTGNWQKMNLVTGGSGGQLENSLGSANTLTGYGEYADLAGVTAIGFYTYQSTTVGFDEITIMGVPEPTTALLGFAGIGLLALRRKR